MPLNFPDSPALNATHSVGDRTWKWNGTGWQYVSDGVISTAILQPSYLIDSNVTLGTNKNGLSVGPVEVAAGYAVTVPANATWMVL